LRFLLDTSIVSAPMTKTPHRLAVGDPQLAAHFLEPTAQTAG
jgi:hypothetical protein